MEHEHLEHVEHHSHEAHSPFDRRVAMTMAITAAVLACVTLLSHRSHTDTLRLQSEANVLHTKASDQWSYFQAKKNRQYLYEALADLPVVLAAPTANGDGNSAGKKRIEDWKGKTAQYKTESKDIEEKARDLEREAEERMEASHCAHHHADRFDYGELGIELALVLCSVAVLTKRPGFWYGGMASGVAGAIVAATAFLLH